MDVHMDRGDTICIPIENGGGIKKIEPRSFLGSGGEIFQCFFFFFFPHIWAWWPPCLMMQNLLNNLITGL